MTYDEEIRHETARRVQLLTELDAANKKLDMLRRRHGITVLAQRYLLPGVLMDETNAMAEEYLKAIKAQELAVRIVKLKFHRCIVYDDGGHACIEHHDVLRQAVHGTRFIYGNGYMVRAVNAAEKECAETTWKQ